MTNGVNCPRCNKFFKYKCYLNKHLANKFICRDINEKSTITVKESQITVKESQLTAKESLISNIESENIIKTSNYQCKYCNKYFKRSWNLKEHLEKNKCKIKNDNVRIYEVELGINPEYIKNKCRFCNYTFPLIKNYQRHMRAGCKHKEEYEIQLEKRVLKARSDYANKIINNTTNNTHNDNITNIQTQNNIHLHLPPLRAFGEENLDYITLKDIIFELKKVKDVCDLTPMISNLTKMIHANPAHPENHNVQITSLNSAHGRVFNGIQFENQDVISIQDTILNKIGDTVMEKVEDSEESVVEVENALIKHGVKGHIRKERIMETLDEDIKGDIGRSNDQNSRKYRHKVKNVLYNNRSSISQTERAQYNLLV